MIPCGRNNSLNGLAERRQSRDVFVQIGIVDERINVLSMMNVDDVGPARVVYGNTPFPLIAPGRRHMQAHHVRSTCFVGENLKPGVAKVQRLAGCNRNAYF